MRVDQTELQSLILVLLEYGANKEECDLPASADTCSTVDGAQPYRKCVFPFRYAGKTYCGCNADDVETDGIWCSTRQSEALSLVGIVEIVLSLVESFKVLKYFHRVASRIQRGFGTQNTLHGIAPRWFFMA